MSTSYEAPHYAVFSSLPIISSLFRPNIVLSTLFANTVSLYCSLNVRNHVSHPYRTIAKSRSFIYISNFFRSRDSAVSRGTGYGLDDRGVGVLVPVGPRIFTSPIVQTGSGVHSTSYTMGTGGSLPGVKRQGRDAEVHPLPHTS
jgi:hypothetical protein